MIINRIFIIKVFKLLALINHSYKNFSLKRVFKKRSKRLKLSYYNI